jgi:hypothetical protein
VDADGLSLVRRDPAGPAGCSRRADHRSMPCPMPSSPQADQAPENRRPTRCPRCATPVRGDVPWCTACYTRFDAVPDAMPGAVPDAVPDPVSDASTSAAGRAVPADVSLDLPARTQLRSEPATDPSTDPATDPADEVDAVAARLLAELAASRTQPGWARRLPGSRAGRTALAAALLAGCSVVLLTSMTLLGLAL